MTNVNIDANQLEDVLCVACGSREFVPRVILKYLPGILSPNGSPGIVTIADGVRCVSCGNVISLHDQQMIARDFNMQDKKDGSGLIIPGGAHIPPAIKNDMKTTQGQSAKVVKLTDVRSPEKKDN